MSVRVRQSVAKRRRMALWSIDKARNCAHTVSRGRQCGGSWQRQRVQHPGHSYTHTHTYIDCDSAFVCVPAERRVVFWGAQRRWRTISRQEVAREQRVARLERHTGDKLSHWQQLSGNINSRKKHFSFRRLQNGEWHEIPKEKISQPHSSNIATTLIADLLMCSQKK